MENGIEIGSMVNQVDIDPNMILYQDISMMKNVIPIQEEDLLLIYLEKISMTMISKC